MIISYVVMYNVNSIMMLLIWLLLLFLPMY